MAWEKEQRLRAEKARDMTLSQYCGQEALLSHLVIVKAFASTQLEGLGSIVAKIFRDVTDLSVRLRSL